jgi:hypothetical protein
MHSPTIALPSHSVFDRRSPLAAGRIRLAHRGRRHGPVLAVLLVVLAVTASAPSVASARAVGSKRLIAERSSSATTLTAVPTLRHPFHGNGPLSSTQSALSQSVAAWLTAVVNQIAANQSPTNPIGLWIGGDPVQWRASSGPGLAAASVAALNRNPTMLTDAIQTFDTLIDLHEQPNGSFTAAAGTSDPQSPDIDTMFFVTNLGMALWALHAQLTTAQERQWTLAIARGAHFLLANGNLSFYTNGNINVGNALVMALAYWATGDAPFERDYQKALAFAESPPQAKWPGFGFVYTKMPTQADGSDGSGYFAESGGGAPGFDADYTELQLDQLVRLYLVTDSAAILRLINLEFNQEWPLVNTSDWMLNTSGGTRHPQANRTVPYSTPALAFLALYGGRTDLLTDVQSQVAATEQYDEPFVTNWNPGGVYGFGVEVASLVLMAESP